MNKKITAIGRIFNAEERETSILFDHSGDRVFLETTEPYTARRWYQTFKDDPKVRFDNGADSLKMEVPTDYCRKPELIIKSKHRKLEEQK